MSNSNWWPFGQREECSEASSCTLWINLVIWKYFSEYFSVIWQYVFLFHVRSRPRPRPEAQWKRERHGSFMFFPMTWQEPSQTRTWWPRSACEHYSMKCQMIVQRPVTSGKVWSCCDRMSFGKLKGKFKRAQTDSNSKFGFSSSKGLESRTHIDQRVGCWSHETRSRIVDACWIMPLLPLAISWKQVKQYSVLLVIVPSTLTPLTRVSIPLLTIPSPSFDFLLIQNLPLAMSQAVPSCPKLPVVKVLPHVRGLQATSACAHWLEALACLVFSLLIHYSEAKAETQLAFTVYSCIQYTLRFLLE